MEENPAVTYLIEGRLPRAVPDLTDLTSRYFLGIRLNCAQCHDHPFVKWKQEEFWGMAAFFTQIRRRNAPSRCTNAAWWTIRN
jgi:cytochrome c